MPSQGDIVLIPIPFTDLSSRKRRPVIVISNDEYNRTAPDVVVVAMTSNAWIWTSGDSGATWTQGSQQLYNGASSQGRSLRMSADGTTVVAVVSGGKIWTSVTRAHTRPCCPMISLFACNQCTE